MKAVSKLSLFLIFTFGISYTMAALFYILGGNYASLGGTVLAIVYMFIPAISAIIVEKMIYRGNIRNNLLVSITVNKWFFVAWMLPVVIVFLTLGISLLFPGVNYASGMDGMISRFENILTPEQIEEMQTELENMAFPPVLLVLIQGLLAGITINAIAGFGEELGWRGFLIRQFERMKFWKVSLIIGFIWGIWHVPLILMGHNYPQHPVEGVLMMIIWCILLSPLFLYITIKSKSVIAASIMHGTLNAIGALSIMMVTGGNDLLTGITGLSGFLALGIIIVFMIVYDRTLSRDNILKGPIGDALAGYIK